jgi:hypothetical protein
MKALLFTLALLPATALAQFEELGIPGYPQPIQPNPPVYGIPVQPVLPVPRDRGPWGTGYSVVTETKERPDAFGRFLGDRDATTTTTTQKVVPNDALGNPIKGMDIW